jgi:hypothetical protein
MSMKNSNDITGNRSRDLPVCSTVPQPPRHRVPYSGTTPNLPLKLALTLLVTTQPFTDHFIFVTVRLFIHFREVEINTDFIFRKLKKMELRSLHFWFSTPLENNFSLLSRKYKVFLDSAPTHTIRVFRTTTMGFIVGNILLNNRIC